MAAAPAIVRFVGGSVPDALATTERMYQVTLTENSAMAIPIMGSRGLADRHRRMVGWIAGTGQVGAGLVQPPQVCFEQALAALGEEARTGAWPPLPACVAG